VPKEYRVDTDRVVTVEETRGIIRGRGFAFDNKSKTVNFKSNVSGTFQPSTAPAK
jgi:lipopolysaccharide export system protein LptC